MARSHERLHYTRRQRGHHRRGVGPQDGGTRFIYLRYGGTKPRSPQPDRRVLTARAPPRVDRCPAAASCGQLCAQTTMSGKYFYHDQWVPGKKSDFASNKQQCKSWAIELLFPACRRDTVAHTQREQSNGYVFYFFSLLSLCHNFFYDEICCRPSLSRFDKPRCAE
jgi:hypothetical protein